MEAAEAKELIEEAIEETEAREDKARSAERALERRFRDRTSLLVGLFALLLAVIHTLAAGAQRDSVLSSIEASDTWNYMQAKTVRETVLVAMGNNPGLDKDVRAAELAEASRLRQPDKHGHGIVQLQAKGEALRKESEKLATAAEGYELGETAMQIAIVMLSIALIAQNRRVVWGAAALALAGVVLAGLTAVGAAFA
jgi:hypothetical protein